jgi:hypothetical protein
MSCLGPDYNPQPARAWSRVQNICSTINVNVNVDSNYELSYLPMINKGNILQYKKNSSSLTKNQRYSKIAKGMWTNRTKTWATQSQIYTNPNTTSLKRVNYVDVALPTDSKDPFNCNNITYKDGGSLLCNQTVNPCTNEDIGITYNNLCYPTSDSDVPGPVIPLCWNSKIQTWYPKQRLIMTNSTNKWPINYKLFKSANAIPSENK